MARANSHSIRLPAMERIILGEQVAAYADASGDRNPLHLDPQFAATTQFGGIIAHGMLTLALVSQMLTAAFGRHWLETGQLKVRFKGPAYLRDTVTTWGEMGRQVQGDDGCRVECSVGLKNQKDEELITGTATVIIPKELPTEDS